MSSKFTLIAVAALSAFAINTARADASEASVFGSLLIGSVVAATPITLSAGTAALTVKAVDKTAKGMSWLVVNASTGASYTLELSGNAAAHASVQAGTVLTASAHAAGTLLSAGGLVLAIVPNAVVGDLFFSRLIGK
jgi:hypothetical protein